MRSYQTGSCAGNLGFDTSAQMSAGRRNQLAVAAAMCRGFGMDKTRHRHTDRTESRSDRRLCCVPSAAPYLPMSLTRPTTAP
jgi:hypothetical protein